MGTSLELSGLDKATWEVFTLRSGEEVVEQIWADCYVYPTADQLRGMDRGYKYRVASGKMTLTNQRILFYGNRAYDGAIHFEIAYADIEALKPAMNFIIPCAFWVITKDGRSKFGTWKRKKIMALIEQYMGA